MKFEFPKEFPVYLVRDYVDDPTGDYGWKKIADLPSNEPIGTRCPLCHERLATDRDHIVDGKPLRCPHCHRCFAYALHR